MPSAYVFKESRADSRNVIVKRKDGGSLVGTIRRHVGHKGTTWSIVGRSVDVQYRNREEAAKAMDPEVTP